MDPRLPVACVTNAMPLTTFGAPCGLRPRTPVTNATPPTTCGAPCDLRPCAPRPVTNETPPTTCGAPCDLRPCAPRSYRELRVDTLNVRMVTIGSCCAAMAQLGALTARQACVDGLLASGSVTATSYRSGAVTATAAAATGDVKIATLEAAALALNGASVVPQAVLVKGGAFALSPGFASHGSVLVQPGATGVSVALPSGGDVPVGYTVLIYNLASEALPVVTSPSYRGVDGITTVTGAPNPTTASVTLPATSVARFVYLGAAAWLAS